MVTIRRQRTKHYAIIEQDALDDSRISLAALGLLVWLQARPEGRETQDALDRFGLDRAALDALLAELDRADLIESVPS